MMGEVAICDVCGNEVDTSASSCPFCGAKRPAAGQNVKISCCRVVNLEKGMPRVEQALRKMKHEISIASGLGYKAMVLIHGYGSSGKGGTIRNEVRRQLQLMFEQKVINDFLEGEKCDDKVGHFR